ncbi:Helicase conserved domain containing protein [Reticulomyxa filosa]|uniref:Helicase conserved domain containing protein n=1 Tax=Reticulomyxa filosa TaxID=46433 RepID=X6LR09_RETFI|nr:Helicase conserved domain containing protein [Reticulomyxa filosa]|eukprot:ETO03180.1 Helicase conserved domain containing protein [Reticulomyxa filosa]
MLCEQNRGTDEKKYVRTMVFMDATGSMSHLLQKSKHSVSTMFERINVILEENNSPNSFEMQFVPRYGDGNEAIEAILAYVNRELETYYISQVILIGDAPPNTQREMKEIRRNNELRQLMSCNILVHAFFICERAEQSFREIARVTNGRCEKLDINSEKGSDQLTNLVSDEVLRNIGGSKGDTLVDAYKKKFSKSCTAQILDIVFQLQKGQHLINYLDVSMGYSKSEIVPIVKQSFTKFCKNYLANVCNLFMKTQDFFKKILTITF